MRRLRRWLVRLMVVAMVVAAGAMAFRIWWLPHIVHDRLSAALADAGWPHARFEVRAVSLHSLDLANVSLGPAQPPAAGSAPESPEALGPHGIPGFDRLSPHAPAGLHIAHLRARYHWRSLWRERRIDAVEFTGVNWRIVASPRGIDWGLPASGKIAAPAAAAPAPLPPINIVSSTIEIVVGDNRQRIPIEGALRPAIVGISDATTCNLRVDAPLCPVAVTASITPMATTAPGGRPPPSPTTKRRVHAELNLLNTHTRIIVTGELDDRGGADLKAAVAEDGPAVRRGATQPARLRPTAAAATELPDFRARFTRESDGPWALWANGRLRVAGLDVTGRVSANPQETHLVLNAVELGQDLMQASEMAALEARLRTPLRQGTHELSGYCRFKRPPAWLRSLLATRGATIQSLDGCTITSKLEATWKDGWRVVMPSTRLEIEGLSATVDRGAAWPRLGVGSLTTAVELKAHVDERGFGVELPGPVQLNGASASASMNDAGDETTLRVDAWALAIKSRHTEPLLAWRGAWGGNGVEFAYSVDLATTVTPAVQAAFPGMRGSAAQIAVELHGTRRWGQPGGMIGRINAADLTLSTDAKALAQGLRHLTFAARSMSLEACTYPGENGEGIGAPDSLAELIADRPPLAGLGAAMSHLTRFSIDFGSPHLQIDNRAGEVWAANLQHAGVTALTFTQLARRGRLALDLSGTIAQTTPEGFTRSISVDHALLDLFRQPPAANDTGASVIPMSDPWRVVLRLVRPVYQERSEARSHLTSHDRKGVVLPRSQGGKDRSLTVAARTDGPYSVVLEQVAAPATLVTRAASAHQVWLESMCDGSDWLPRQGRLRIAEAYGFDDSLGFEGGGFSVDAPLDLARLSAATRPTPRAGQGRFRLDAATLRGASIPPLRGFIGVHQGAAAIEFDPLPVSDVIDSMATDMVPATSPATGRPSPMRVQATQPAKPLTSLFSGFIMGPFEFENLRQQRAPLWFEPFGLAAANASQPATQPSSALHIAGELDILAPALTGQITASAQDIDLRRLTPVAQNIPLLQGLSFDGRASVKADLQLIAGRLVPRIDIHLIDAAVRDPINGGDVEGVTAQLTLDGLSPVTTPAHQVITVKALDLGQLKLSDGRVALQLESDGGVFLEDMRWGLPEGGTVRTSAVRIAPTRAASGTQSSDSARGHGPVQRIDAELLFEDLSLKSWLALLSADHLTGEGRLYGRLPISIRPGAADMIRFGEGFLYASPDGGYVKVQSAKAVDELLSKPDSAGAAIVQQVQKRALEALYDFQFSMLRFDFVREQGKGVLCRVRTAGKGRTGENPQEIGSLTVNIADFDRYLSGAIMAKMQLGGLGETMKKIMERRERLGKETSP